MEMEVSKTYYPEELKKINETRDRVEKLRDTDGKKEDSVYDLAVEENKFREDLKDEGVTDAGSNRLADKYSTKALGEMEGKKLSLNDELTGLKNRRALRIEVPNIIRLAKREKNNCAVLLLDLDKFKAVNDTYGHKAGDEILIKFAECVSANLRKSDLFYRYGGEEFIIVLPNASEKGATILADKIREAIENTNFEVSENGQDEKIHLKKTVSIGVANMKQLSSEKLSNFEEEKIVDDLIIMADKAAYESKSGGRNRVTVYGEEAENQNSNGETVNNYKKAI